MRKVRILIIFLTGLMMLAVWPFCLVRKGENVDSMLGVEYGVTQASITKETPFEQKFIAQTARINGIAFDLEYQGNLSGEGSILFELLDANRKTVFSNNVDFSEINSGQFCMVPVGKWIKKGQEYTFRLSVSEEYDGVFGAFYTREAQQHAAGSVQLSIGDEIIKGQGVARYEYGYPLNIKNIICLWAFILTAAMTVSKLIKCKDGRDEKVFVKMNDLMDKYQWWILLAQFAGILLMTVFICRNRAVDWDEAYSFQMVTKYTFEEMIQRTAADIHPPLYYILLRLFSGIFGTGFFVMKLFSVLFIALTMVVGMVLVRKNWGWRVSFAFNLVVGLGPQFIYYSVNIRMYSMALFFVTCCALLAYEILQESRPLQWILFILSALGAVYTHYFAVVPLVIIYGYLLLGLFLFHRKAIKYFFLGCLASVLGYLPWLSVVVQSFHRFGSTGNMDVKTVDFADYFQWAFATNIKFSEAMPVFLFVLGIVLLIYSGGRKVFSSKEKLFLGMCVINFLLSYAISRLIASTNGHFWHNRYVFPVLGMFWLFLTILYVRQGKRVFFTYTVWLAVISASAFIIQKAVELGTVDYLQQAYSIIEPVRKEKVVIYDYTTYDVFFGAHLPEQEFVFYDEVDFDAMDGDYVYFISWAGNWFPQEVVEKYHIEAQDCGTMRFEEGVAGVKLYKITFEK